MSGSERKRGFFVSGGTLPAHSASYIERKTDVALLESLVAGRFCYVLNPRQIGKSSLSVHAIGRLKERGIRTAFIDLTRIGGKNVTPEQWYLGIALEIARELNCRREVVAYWNEHESTALVQRLFGMIRDIALADGKPLVLFIDEIDATRSLPFDPDELFASIRECFNRRVSEPVFEKLTFCLLGVAVPSDLVRNRATTPFNIGERMLLEDFTLEELSAYASELGPKGKDVISRVHYWTGGHPFLSQSMCRSIAAQEGVPDAHEVDKVVERELFDFKARDSNINLADVANIALHYRDPDGDAGVHRADVLSLYERVLAGRQVVDDESNRAVVILKLSGIVKTDGRRLHIRNRIYEKVFDRKWIEEHMPEQELRRQRQSFRRGVLRTALITGSLLAVFGVVAAVAWFSRLQAVRAQGRLDYELYVSDMNSLRLFYDNGDTARIEAILERHRRSPYRGFEWGYWLGRYHDASEEYTLDYNAQGKREQGHISTDGKKICITDSLLLTATILDRATKKVVVTRRIDSPEQVMALRSRWVEVRRLSSSQFQAMDLTSGRSLTVLGEPGWNVMTAAPVEHTDYVALTESLPTIPNRFREVLCNVETGRPILALKEPGKGASSLAWGVPIPFTVSMDGRLAAYMTGPSGGSAAGHVNVVELSTGSVIDSFPVGALTSSIVSAADGGWLFLIDEGKGIVRNTVTHESKPWRPQTLADWQLLAGTISGNTLVTLLDHGRCIATDLVGKQREAIRDNVTWIETGARRDQYLAGSNSVRLYDARRPANAVIAENANRVTRYARGILNFFSAEDPAITRVNEVGYRTMGTVPRTGDAGSYTYSGRWYLVRHPDEADQLKDVEGKLAPIALPVRPTMWSCGRMADSIAAWNLQTGKLIAYSGLEKRILWTHSNVQGLNAIWVSPDGAKLFLGSKDRDIDVFDMRTGKDLGAMNAHNLGPVYLTFTADGRQAFTCGGEGSVALWDLATLRKRMVFKGNDQEGMTSADLSPDGQRVVTTTRSGSWQIWDASNGVQLLDMRASGSPLSSAIFCADGRRIITAGYDGQVRVWQSVDADPTVHVPIDPVYLAKLRR